MRVLVACEKYGRVRDAFRKKGHDAVSCDLEDSVIPGPHIKGNVFGHLNDGWDMMIAFYPCQRLAVSGARWFKQYEKEQKQAIKEFLILANADIEHIALENPIGVMSTHYRKPDQIIQPWMFGHGETKATCLWLKNLPLLQPTDIVEGRENRVWRMPPSPDRGELRGITYQGIADAMATQWGNDKNTEAIKEKENE